MRKWTEEGERGGEAEEEEGLFTANALHEEDSRDRATLV